MNFFKCSELFLFSLHVVCRGDGVSKQNKINSTIEKNELRGGDVSQERRGEVSRKCLKRKVNGEVEVPSPAYGSIKGKALYLQNLLSGSRKIICR